MVHRAKFGATIRLLVTYWCESSHNSRRTSQTSLSPVFGRLSALKYGAFIPLQPPGDNVRPFVPTDGQSSHSLYRFTTSANIVLPSCTCVRQRGALNNCRQCDLWVLHPSRLVSFATCHLSPLSSLSLAERSQTRGRINMFIALNCRPAKLAWLTVLLLFFCVVASTPRRIHAQTSKGILAGVIRDSTGAVLPNASVVISNEDTGETRT